MTTTAAPWRVRAVRWRDLHVWSPRSFVEAGWAWPAESLRPLGAALQRRQEAIERDGDALGDLRLITIRFSGAIEPREVRGTGAFKGRLFRARAGDVVYSKIDVRNGAIGVVPPELPEVAVSSEYPVYQVVPEVADAEYVALLFRTARFRAIINAMVSGASGRKRVEPEALEEIEIPLPPLAVQHTIVERWRAAQAEVAAARGRAGAGEEKIAAIVYEILGSPPPTNREAHRLLLLPWRKLDRWSVSYFQRERQGLSGFVRSRFPIVTLAECIAETMNGRSIRPTNGPAPYRVLKLSALTPQGLDLSEAKRVQTSPAIADRFRLRAGDLLVCRSIGSYDQVAKCAVVEEDEPAVLFPDIMIAVRFDDRILPEFIRELIQTPIGRSYFQSRARTAVGMWKIGAEDIRNFPTPLPPLDIQRALVERVREVRAEAARERVRAERLERESREEVEALIRGKPAALRHKQMEVA